MSLGNGMENKLWEVADQLRANSRLKSSEYSFPILGLIFLRYADHKFTHAEKEIKKQTSGGRRGISKTDFQAKGIMSLPDNARFSYLLKLPEGENIGKAINEAMKAIEAENEELKDVLPKSYNRLENDVLIALLKLFSSIQMDIEGDVFGKIYEYFLGKFAMSEGQRGGEFFTPTSIVKLIVDVIEPFHGRIYDPACGSGGMFVQSAKFVERHKKRPSSEIMVYGQEKVAETVRLCKMNLAVHGLSGDIRQGNSYYEDIHNSFGKFDFVMANPPFNIDRAHRDFLPEQIEFISNIVRLYKGEPIETESGSAKLMKEHFPKAKYQDVAGLCRVAPIEKIREHGYSLNPGRYVGVAEKEGDEFDFYERLEEMNEELEQLNVEARELEERIAGNIARLIEVAEQ